MGFGSRWPSFAGGEEALAAARASLLGLAFDARWYSGDDLVVLAAEMFYQASLDVHLKIPRSSIQSFVLSVRARMIDNAYHNWIHVADVTQTVYCLANLAGVWPRLAHHHKLALLIAALCHDLEHPGVNASFLVKSNSALASLYRGNADMLEKHHSLRAFELLANKDIRLLGGMTSAEQAEALSLVRDVIMATDMAHHSDFLAALRKHLSAISASSDAASQPHDEPIALSTSENPVQNLARYDYPQQLAYSISHSDANESAASASCAQSKEGQKVDCGAKSGGGGPVLRSGDFLGLEDARLYMQLLMKISDVSNVLKAFSTAKHWAVCVTDEFFTQGDLERAAGLEISPMCDRTTQSRVALQHSFIDFVIRPFTTAMTQLFPKIQPLLNQMEQNRKHWDLYNDEDLLDEVCRERAIVLALQAERARLDVTPTPRSAVAAAVAAAEAAAAALAEPSTDRKLLSPPPSQQSDIDIRRIVREEHRRSQAEAILKLEAQLRDLPRIVN